MSWLPKQIVVVPIDFSESSVDAALVAKDMAKESSGLHVINVQLAAYLEESAGNPEYKSDDVRISNAQMAVEEFLDKHGIHGATTVVRIGSPGIEVANYARETNADLIVIPSHGRTGLRHLLLGSVAERVARLAPCPVLILRRNN